MHALSLEGNRSWLYWLALGTDGWLKEKDVRETCFSMFTHSLSLSVVPCVYITILKIADEIKYLKVTL